MYCICTCLCIHRCPPWRNPATQRRARRADQQRVCARERQLLPQRLRPGRVETSCVWGFDYNFTNDYKFKNNLDCLNNVLPER